MLAAAVPAPAENAACSCDNGDITLSPGFCATVFAGKLGHARRFAVAPNGVVYVNTWSGWYYHNDTPPPGGFLIALQSTKGGDGRADKIVRFGPTQAEGNADGTGIAIYKNYIYAEANDRIVRYALPATGIAATAAPETVISRPAAHRRLSDAPLPNRQAGQPLRRSRISHELLPARTAYRT